MPVKCEAIFRLIEEMAPRSMAESWDNAGLQAGDPRAEVARALLTLDVNLDVAREALEKGAGLIISHHPMLFKPLESIDLSRPAGELIGFLIKNNITVYAAHTNLDSAAGGVNDILAARLGLQKLAVLQQSGQVRYVKLAVFVPEDHAAGVRDAIAGAGAGWIGNYSDCTFMTRGTGTFKPLAGANPYLGKTGELEQVEEIKLETIVPTGIINRVIQAMLKAHPYEEVAYDLYPLENRGPSYGLGRVGELPRQLTFSQFMEQVKTVLRLPALRTGGQPAAGVKKVAVCGGSGADLWPAALKAGADTIVTGDIKYHVAQEMLDAGLKFIDAGHHGTEAVIMPVLQDFLAERCRAENLRIDLLLAQTNTDPFAYF
ncbi:MAG: Nif3-like dinuclear metal center hexameric protein [Peptococcaceae bacterium]|nr:Nif3-like dinuclear metal center hexameric protein [Peptococcaceae bacterium]